MPLCLGRSTSVRARSIPNWAVSAAEFQTFWPETIHSSPSRTARVATLARSEPEPGSLNSWHQAASPVAIGPTKRVDLLGGAVSEDRRRGERGGEVPDRGGHRPGPADLVGDDAGRGSAEPAPPTPSGQVGCDQPASARRRHHSRSVSSSLQLSAIQARTSKRSALSGEVVDGAISGY